MCLAIPSKVLSVEGKKAVVDMGGAEKEVSLRLVPSAKKDDYVLIHAGYAIEIISTGEAMETLRIIGHIAGLQQNDKKAVQGEEK